VNAMTSFETCRRFAIGLLLTAPSVLSPGTAVGQARDDPSLSVELIDPKVFRVCADPHNLPFSNEGGEGFENKIAELIARKLDKSLAYSWYPQSVGFVRNTLNAHKCDVIMGFPQGGDLAQSTNPYYRTAYAFVFRRGKGLDGIESLSDARLKDKRIGVVAGTPPATYLAMNGLLGTVKGYQLVVDTRVDSSGEAMIKDLTAGEIDLGIMWGPMAGYYAAHAGTDMAVVPLVKDNGGPRLAYRIGLGVRATDQEWKRQLNRLIRDAQPDITRILLGYGVPLLDDNDQPIAAPAMK
jgi:quinoprotein dehydrogenase-associated probable ABC transporter substrate-binding protein